MKICSICGKEYDEERSYCDICGIKLDDVAETGEPEREEEPVEQEIESEEIEEVSVVEESADIPPEGDVRCPVCGTKNPGAAKFCMSCAAELADAEIIEEPADEPVEEEKTKDLLLVLPGGKEIEFVGDKMVIGREDFQGVLSEEKLKFITRRDNPDKPDVYHFCILSEDGDYFVMDENSSNDTFLGEEKIQGQGRKPLKDGDEIKPAGEVTIGVRIK